MIALSVTVKDDKEYKMYFDGKNPEEVGRNLLKLVREEFVNYATESIEEAVKKKLITEDYFTYFNGKKVPRGTDPRSTFLATTNKTVGKIELVSTGIVEATEAILFAYQYVAMRSPVLTGRYKNSHLVYLNGVAIASSLSELSTVLKSIELKETDRVRIVNITPYARKLERWGNTAQNRATKQSKTKKTKHGERAGKPLLIPNGVYVLSARAIKKKYGKLSDKSVRFVFMTGDAIGVHQKGRGTFAGSGVGSGRQYLYPTLVFDLAGFSTNMLN